MKNITVNDLSSKGADRHKVRSLLEHLAQQGLADKSKDGNKVVSSCAAKQEILSFPTSGKEHPTMPH